MASVAESMRRCVRGSSTQRNELDNDDALARDKSMPDAGHHDGSDAVAADLGYSPMPLCPGDAPDVPSHFHVQA